LHGIFDEILVRMDTKGKDDSLKSQAYFNHIRAQSESFLTEFGRILYPHIKDMAIIKRVAIKALDKQKEINNGIMAIDPKKQTEMNKALLDMEDCIKSVNFDIEEL
jgi:hypothetical protein